MQRDVCRGMCAVREDVCIGMRLVFLNTAALRDACGSGMAMMLEIRTDMA